MKKHYEKIWEIVIVVMFLICVFVCLLDLVNNKQSSSGFLWKTACWWKTNLKSIGFTRKTAMELLKSSLGLIITMLTFALNISVNLFNRYERKVYGIPYGELFQHKTIIRKIFYIISLALPILVVITINLGLCATSYVLLLYSYVLVFYNYGSYGRSYDKAGMRADVISKLIACVENVDLADEQFMDFDAIIDDIRKEIWSTEGWNNAWLLLNDFIEQVMKFDDEKIYVLSCHLWEIFLGSANDRKIQNSLVYVKKFINRMGKSDVKYERELIVLWSLLCCTALQWESTTLKEFLVWFVDIKDYDEKRSLLKEAGMLLLMLEYRFYTKNDCSEIDVSCVDRLYKYGWKCFLEEEQYIENLSSLYEKQYEIKDWNPHSASRILCMDIKYGLNNSLIRTNWDI